MFGLSQSVAQQPDTVPPAFEHMAIGAEYLNRKLPSENFRMSSYVTSIGYETQTGPYNTYMYSAAGINKLILTSVPGTANLYDGNISWYITTSVRQPWSILFVDAGITYLKSPGEVTQTDNNQFKYTYTNIYHLFEFPVGLGAALRWGSWRGTVMVTKSWFYGVSSRDVVYESGDSSVDLGTDKNTFITQLPVFYQASVLYRFSPRYSFTVDYSIGPAGTDRGYRIRLWTPLR